jgi:hypothetical protein
MFKATYKDEFYLSLRNALHAEVDSWRNGASAGNKECNRLWEKVFALEPDSRNSEATIFAPSATTGGRDQLVHLQVAQAGGIHG